ncbi:hypothetical protein LCGC14_2549170 [marine sediment metagenome]|uniref:Uncharacterized protein n=1 Tax=marine sediment metagenome TaxID=412755 RepID=A0A0F9ANW5_9ZZZZ
MAKTIKETPILRGKDAKRFSASVEKSASRKVPGKEYNRAKAVYSRVMSRQGSKR